MKYLEFKSSDFWDFFGVSELKKIEINKEAGLIKRELKPGGFKEYIDLEIITNEDEEIVNGKLKLHREWIGSVKNINPFAIDIIKSFIDVLAPKEDKLVVIRLADTLFQIHGTEDEVIYLEDCNIKLEINEQNMEVIKVLLGLKESYTYTLSRSMYVFSFKKEEGIAKVMIEFILIKSTV